MFIPWPAKSVSRKTEISETQNAKPKTQNCLSPCQCFKNSEEFALKGNVIDLAVGVIIGAAFGKIVTSLVNNIFGLNRCAVCSGSRLIAAAKSAAI